MKKRLIIVAFVVALVLTFVLPWMAHAEWVRVDRVIDGDTFVTSDGTKVRIKNVDTPETKYPTKGKELRGEEATQIAKFLLEGNYVWLEGKTKDKYGRRLATVKLPCGRLYADILRSYGYDKKFNNIHSYSDLSHYYLGGDSLQPRSLNPYSYSSPLYSSGLSYSGSSKVPVRGYYRKDGTYVKPHYRSKPKR